MNETGREPPFSAQRQRDALISDTIPYLTNQRDEARAVLARLVEAVERIPRHDCEKPRLDVCCIAAQDPFPCWPCEVGIAHAAAKEVLVPSEPMTYSGPQTIGADGDVCICGHARVHHLREGCSICKCREFVFAHTEKT